MTPFNITTTFHEETLSILMLGSDIRIPSNGIITVMKMICLSGQLTNVFNFKVVPFSFPTLSTSRKLARTLKSIPAFFYSLPRVRIVHIHHATGFNFYLTVFFAFMSSLFGKKVILHNHGADFKEFFAEQNPLMKKLTRSTFNRVDYVITLSESWKGWHLENLGEKASWIVMQNPTPLEQPANPNPVRLDDLTVLYMSRLEQRKGVYDLLNVIPPLADRFSGITFVFAGDGDVGPVSSWVKERSLENNVRVVGWVDKQKKLDLLSNTDIFVLPSYNEGLPMALLEAMGFGIPCAATTVGGIPELIHDRKNGMLFSPGDINGMEQALVSLIGDRSLRKTLGQSAYTTIKDSYSLESYLNRLEQLYRKLTVT